MLLFSDLCLFQIPDLCLLSSFRNCDVAPLRLHGRTAPPGRTPAGPGGRGRAVLTPLKLPTYNNNNLQRPQQRQQQPQQLQQLPQPQPRAIQLWQQQLQPQPAPVAIPMEQGQPELPQQQQLQLHKQTLQAMRHQQQILEEENRQIRIQIDQQL